MLLRRITKHVKDQNWFAVVLDFVIVVAGILIAFQITNWNEERQEKRVYDAAFERVIVEMNKNLGMQMRVRKNISEELPIIQRALEDLRTCRNDETALANVKTALVPLNAPYAILFETAALQQFLSNDAFLQYQAPEARKLLTELLRIVSFYLEYDQSRRAQLSSKYASMPDTLALGPLAVSGPDEILKMMLSDKPLSPPLHREPILTVPLDVACQDKDFIAGFYDWEDGAFQVSIIAGLLQPQLRAALVALGRPVEVKEGNTP